MKFQNSNLKFEWTDKPKAICLFNFSKVGGIYCLIQVKSIAECSKGSILQYFRPSLSYHLSLRSLFCLFWSGLFTQVLLYLQYDEAA